MRVTTRIARKFVTLRASGYSLWAALCEAVFFFLRRP